MESQSIHLQPSSSRQSVNEQARRQKQSIKKLLLDYQYIEAVNAYDLVHNNDQLIQYFSIIGMDDPDISHTIMTIKEMIHCKYELNQFKDDIANNSGVLTGDRPFIKKEGLPKFHVPIFQPKVLSKVPDVDRAKLLFPINLADFLFKDGVRVLSANEVFQKRTQSLSSSPNLKQYPFISHYGTQISDCTEIQQEKVFTNQEGKMYVVTSLNYFIDVADIEIEFKERGHFKQYKNLPKHNGSDIGEENNIICEIANQIIPPGRYFLPFKMCFITLKSFKHQMFTLLQSLYTCYVNTAMPKYPKPDQPTFEQCLNKIMFGIPSPPKKAFQYMDDYLPSLKNWSNQQKPVVEVQMFEKDPKDKLYFQNENPFDLPNSNFENIWVLLSTLSAEHVCQLFKRLLFSTCNILVSDDAKKLNQCIQGIIELFFPITIDLVVIPNLPETMLEYVNMCGQCVIGVVKYTGDKSTDDKKRRNTRDTKKEENQKEHTKTLVNGELINLFDVMQDNSCQIYLDVNYSIQKPRQVVGFNAMGKLALGQSAAKQQNSSKNMSQTSGTNVLMQTQQGNSKQPGVAENLNDVELPKESTKKIREAINKAQKGQHELIEKLQKKMEELNNAQNLNQNSKVEQIKNEIHLIQCKMQARVFEVRLEFYRMIKTIIQAYTDPNLLLDFKGAKAGSRHMTNFMRWHLQHKDIFALIDKKKFKNLARNEESQTVVRQQFYQRLVYYPMLQNYIIEKFFPNNIEDNINQLHGLKHVDIFKKQQELWLKQTDNSKQVQDQQQMQYDSRKMFKKIELYPANYYLAINRANIKKRTCLRALNEALVRKDFLEKYGERLNKEHRELSDCDKKFIEILKTPSEESENLGIVNVVETKYRMTIYYEKLHPRHNILITWLLIFIGSLEYQLNPELFTEESEHKSEKQLSFQSYKNSSYYQAQNKLEQLLAKYFEEVLKVFLYKLQNFFDQKCPLLNILFQYTHKYTTLHQKLIDFVHQEVDQQQAGQAQLGSMAVSNSFMIYQLHWDNKLLRACAQSRKMNIREQQTLDALKKATIKQYERQVKPKQNNSGSFSNTISRQKYKDDKEAHLALIQKCQERKNFVKKCTRLSELFKFLKKNEVADNLDIAKIQQYDPVLLNDFVDQEWTFSRVRLDYLRELAKKDEDINKINEGKFWQKEEELKNNNQSQAGKGQKEKKKKNLFSKIGTLIKSSRSDTKNKLEISKIYDPHGMTDIDMHGSSVIDDHFSETQDFKFNKSRDKKAELQREVKEKLLSQPKLDFKSLLKEHRSFFSLRQLSSAKLVKEGKNIQDIKEDEIFNLDPHIDLDLVCKKENNNQGAIDDFLNFKSTNKSDKDDNQILIVVLLVTELGTFEVTRVNAMHPKALRNGVESLLRVCKNYKTIQQIDLSAFSQDKNNEDYYWNLVFWFKYKSLPYLWMAPFLKHLGKNIQENKASNQQDFDFGDEEEEDPYFKNPNEMWLKFFMNHYKKEEDILKLRKLLTYEVSDIASTVFSSEQPQMAQSDLKKHAKKYKDNLKKIRQQNRENKAYESQQQQEFEIQMKEQQAQMMKESMQDVMMDSQSMPMGSIVQTMEQPQNIFYQAMMQEQNENLDGGSRLAANSYSQQDHALTFNDSSMGNSDQQMVGEIEKMMRMNRQEEEKQQSQQGKY